MSSLKIKMFPLNFPMIDSVEEDIKGIEISLCEPFKIYHIKNGKAKRIELSEYFVDSKTIIAALIQNGKKDSAKWFQDAIGEDIYLSFEKEEVKYIP